MTNSRNIIDREALIDFVWDAYKEAYGIRPRGMGINEMSNAELLVFADDLSAQLRQKAAVKEQHLQLLWLALAHPNGRVDVDPRVLDWHRGNVRDAVLHNPDFCFPDFAIPPEAPKPATLASIWPK